MWFLFIMLTICKNPIEEHRSKIKPLSDGCWLRIRMTKKLKSSI